MNKLKELLHKKRGATETHINELESAGKQGVRYTAMMPDIPFLIVGTLCDFGWLIHLVAGIVYICNYGFVHISDWFALAALVLVMFGVSAIVYLSKVREKEIATKLQKDLSFGMTAFAGLLGAVIAVFQTFEYAVIPTELVWIIAGGVFNFVMGLPLYLSFKKGIHYGVQ